MNCPNCRGQMTAQTLDGHLGTAVTIDACLPCHLFWFDVRENLQLSPAGVLTLFRVIGEQALEPPSAASAEARCPHCRLRLGRTYDRQRNTTFQYLRCPNGHGRLITFVEFLREKDFIKPLSEQQIAELRQSIRTVNCSNCGAPIDLTAHTACAHCRSPLSMLDMKQAGAVVAELRAAAAPRTEIDPTLPLRLARARREVDAAFAELERGPQWLGDVSAGGLVGAGLNALSQWLRRHR